MDKNSLFQYVLSLGLWGGLARFFGDNKHHLPTWRKRALTLAGRMVTAGFTAVLSMPLMLALGFDEYWIIALAGVAGWMGADFARALARKTEGQIKRLGGPEP